MNEHPEIAEHEWFETPYGTFRVEEKRFGTWTSYSNCLLYTSPSPRDMTGSRMPSSA